MNHLTTFKTVFTTSLLLTVGIVSADDSSVEAGHGAQPESIAQINIPESATRSEGLAAFNRIYEVASHPRCANCHVGEDNIPMWSGPSYGKTRPHGMNIDGGVTRIGAEYLMCATCHRTTTELNSEPHAPPHFGINWQLAPVAFEWFGKSPDEICEQLKDPQRNGGRDWRGLVDHLVVDAGHRGPVLWGWNPGGNREPAPYDLQQHVDDMAVWGVAGQPCPSDVNDDTQSSEVALLDDLKVGENQ